MRARMMWTLVFAVAVLTAACGDSKSSLLPTAPSALSSDSSSVDAGTGLSGTMGGNGNGNGGGNNGGGNGNGNGGGGNGNGGGGNGNGNGGGNDRTPTNTSPAPTAPVPPGKAKVEFEGVIEFADATMVKVNGQTVYLTEETVIRHGNRPVPVTELAGARAHVRAARVPVASGGSTASTETRLEAELILVQRPGDPAPSPTPIAVVEPDILVSVTATDNSANESGAPGTNTGTFRLTRTGTATQMGRTLAVNFTLGGTATPGEFVNLPLTANFAANEASVDVIVTPVNDGLAESPETLVLSVSPAAAYELGSPSSATMFVTDNPLPTVTVTASDPNSSEAGDRGRFLLSRSDGNGELVVTITLTGSAVNGVDYPAVSTTQTFQHGELMKTFTIFPTQDNVWEDTEFIIMTVVDGDLYDLGASSSATITVVNVGGVVVGQ